jgi:hypothetical protein
MGTENQSFLLDRRTRICYWESWTPRITHRRGMGIQLESKVYARYLHHNRESPVIMCINLVAADIGSQTCILVLRWALYRSVHD